TKREDIGVEERLDIGGGDEREALRDGLELTADGEERARFFGVGADDAREEAEARGELKRGGLITEKSLGAALNHEAALDGRPDQAAEAICGLEQFDLEPRSELHQAMGGGEPRRSAADDDHLRVHLIPSLRASSERGSAAPQLAADG